MFDIGWPELLLVMVVALIVIGPKDLPAAIRAVTTILRKVRGMAAEFQRGLDEFAREAGVDEIKNSVDDMTSYDPKAALDNIAAMDEGEFSLDDDDEPAAANSILDPAAQPQTFDDDPNAAPAETAEAVTEPADDAVSPAANEDEPSPRPAAPASGNS